MRLKDAMKEPFKKTNEWVWLKLHSLSMRMIREVLVVAGLLFLIFWPAIPILYLINIHASIFLLCGVTLGWIIWFAYWICVFDYLGKEEVEDIRQECDGN